MKTRRFYSILMILMAILFAVSLQASNIYNHLDALANPPLENSASFLGYFENEAYVDDIPFSTAEVEAEYLYQAAVSAYFVNEEEVSVEDIPFNTYKVAEKALYEEALGEVYDFEDEAYINDIPFDTHAQVKAYNCHAQYALHE
jgi:hypothetical protein